MKRFIFTNQHGCLEIHSPQKAMFDVTSNTRQAMTRHGLLVKEIEHQTGHETVPEDDEGKILEFLTNIYVPCIDSETANAVMNDPKLSKKDKYDAIANMEKVAWRFIDDSEVPGDRDFRDAWCDVTPEARIDINLARAKDIALEKLRAERNQRLKSLDLDSLRAMEVFLATGDKTEVLKVVAKKDVLRDATEPLKALKAEGYNDTQLLADIKALATLPNV